MEQVLDATSTTEAVTTPTDTTAGFVTTDLTAVDTTDTVTETVTQVEEVKPTKKELLREMSKEYGVNLFDAEGLAKFKEYQDSLKTEAEKTAEQLSTLKEKADADKVEVDKLNAQIAGLKLGIPEENLKDALALARNNMTDGQSIEDGLKVVQEKYKSMFVKNSGIQTTVQVGTQMSDADGNINAPIDPALQRYLATKKK